MNVTIKGGMSADERAKLLLCLKENGLTIGECVRALSVENDNPYVRAARALVAGGDDVEVDDSTTLSEGEGGAWVLSWLWVSNEEAGIKDAILRSVPTV